ncbi:MAG: molybdenum-dependent transcriptional regulator [Thermoplasmata archaeon]
MTPRTNVVTDRDVALLRSLGADGSVVAASRRLGISRDRAVYRLQRLERAFGGPVVTGARGGAAHGHTRLTELGDRIARRGFDSLELLDARPLSAVSASNVLRGVYHRTPYPEVEVGRSLRLRVAFPGEEGEPVSVLLDPEAVLVARRRFVSSARNVLSATVESIRPAGGVGRTLVVRAGTVRLRAALTAEPVRQLGLRPGAKVVLFVKATALRRAGGPGRPPTRGSPRS